MSILSSTIGALKTGAQGVASVSSGLMSVGKSLASTTQKIAGALTGGPREQTYGYFSKYFPDRDGGEKNTRKEKITRIRPALNPIKQAPIFQASSESVQQIFQFIRKSQEDNIRRMEVQKSFNEERMNEEDKRHKELLEAIKKFTEIKTATAIEKKTDEKSIFDSIKDFISNIDWVKTLKWFITKPIWSLLTNPIVLGIGTILGLAEIFSRFVKLVPDYSMISAQEAKNVLEVGDEKDWKKFGGREKLEKIINDSREAAKEALKTPENLSDEQRKKLEEIANITVTVTTPPPLPLKVPPRPDPTKGSAGPNKAAAWDKQWGDTHNPDGTLKVQQPGQQLPQGVEESKMGAGRGGSAQYDDYLARQQMEETGDKASFTRKPFSGKRSTAVPSTPPSAQVSTATAENRNLEDQQQTAPAASTMVQKNIMGQNVKEPPLPATASLRDNEAMISHLMGFQRRNARAY